MAESHADHSDAHDVAVVERVAAVFSNARNHFCCEWDEGDGCTICWANAVDAVQAAQGFQKCPRCGGNGMVPPGSACDECGGSGEVPLAADDEQAAS